MKESGRTDGRYWNMKLGVFMRNARVDAFLADIEAAYGRHGLCLEHEDHQGSFIVRDLNDGAIRWLRDAHDDSGKAQKNGQT